MLVITLAFGLSIVGSLEAALSYHNQEVQFGDIELGGVLLYEALIGPIVGLVLKARHWKWSDFAFHYSNGTTVLGVAIAGAITLAWCIFGSVVGEVPSVAAANLMLVLAVSLLNPMFEELLVLAYVVQSMRKRFGLMTAMNVSIAIRLMYHLYQGPLAVIPIALFGVLVTVVYVRLGRLWPVVVAHALLDLAGLSGVGC